MPRRLRRDWQSVRGSGMAPEISPEKDPRSSRESGATASPASFPVGTSRSLIQVWRLREMDASLGPSSSVTCILVLEWSNNIFVKPGCGRRRMSLESGPWAHQPLGSLRNPSGPGVGDFTDHHLLASRCLTSVFVKAALPIKKAVGRVDVLPVAVPRVPRRECV